MCIRDSHKADKITVMTVDPGFAGQPFIPEMLDKVAELKAWREREGLKGEINRLFSVSRLYGTSKSTYLVVSVDLFGHLRYFFIRFIFAKN